MVLKLYGSRWSPNAKRVAMVLLEKNEHKTAAYTEKQPFGQVPYIDDDGLILYERRAICRYICKKYEDQGANLVPTDLQAFAMFEQAASNEIYNFDVYVQAAAMESVVKPALGQRTNKTVYEKNIKILSMKLDVYDRILSRQKYIAGADLTLVDLFHIPYTVELEEAGCDIMYSKPNVARWWRELLARESWKAVATTIDSNI
ncbi:glutathione S-transferase [Desarmillaria tabescens]|uniref:glutathione transferase n=1 Tax=Armillaria tabescens TaxID=1929756 RepID=A0AA39KD42_ARMTA|nr:glutathione S-transferase [Desarmillaria tabescens]KAK0458920.1 glutathione S-transferase [Desarmillaria tabescens]